MSESSKTERARRILGWAASHGPWAGSWHYYDASSLEGDLTAIQINDPLLLPPLLAPLDLIRIFPGISLACVIHSAILPPTKNRTADGEFLYSRDEVYKCLDILLNAEAYVSGEVCAKFLDISPSSLRDYSDRGIIPFVQVGKHKKYQLRKVMQKLENDYKSSGVGRIEALKDLLR